MSILIGLWLCAGQMDADADRACTVAIGPFQRVSVQGDIVTESHTQAGPVQYAGPFQTPVDAGRQGISVALLQLSILSAEMKASCGISTLPNWRIRFFPAFCFSSSFFFRVASPP